MSALSTRRSRVERILLPWGIALGVLVAAAFFGIHPSRLPLGLVVAAIAAVVVIRRPQTILLAIVAAALMVPLEFGTGTDVKLNTVTLLLPAAAVLWLLRMLQQGELRVPSSRINLPLLLFLLVGLLSLGIGILIWDPQVFRPANFTLVQLAQWGIFALSALAFWVTASLAQDEVWLWRLTALFLVIGGCLAVAGLVPRISVVTGRFATLALIRAPFWVLLAALAGGQLLYNRGLSARWHLFLLAALLGVIGYSFFRQRDSASNWVGVVAVGWTLLWLRFPRLRWWLVVLVVALALMGVLFPAVYNFAGGTAEWNTSGGSRLALIGRVIEVTMRNPITGLGPAAYRPYTRMTPLRYGGAYWVDPRINSHNNYVDLFSHVGLLGLAVFAWFAVEVAVLGLRLRRRYASGFAAGYVNGMLAAWVGALTIMMLADWILPFVYNIGFGGFQASVLVWLFLGGLVALEGQDAAGEASS
jgi:O-antigen ligase